MNFTSSLLSRNRNYTCSGDVGTFLCSGVGNDLIFYAPPLVNLSSPIQYFQSDNPGDGAFAEPFASTLISTDVVSTGFEMVAVLIVEANAPVQEITVRCIVNSTSEGEAFYRREGKCKHCFSHNNECCKLRCANASRHVMLSLKKY